MAKKTITKDIIKQKLTDKYRLVILNENTFEERFSLKLSRLNVFVIGGLFLIFTIILTSFLIAFSPLKEYIPGYSSTSLKIKATKLVYQADSLKTKLTALENFTKELRPILTGEIPHINIDSLKTEVQRITINQKKLAASKSDSLFREKIESNDRFPLLNNTQNKTKIVLFSPVSGNLIQQFNTYNKHFAVDISAKIGTPVKAIADGTVIFSGWTAQTGYVLIIEHPNNLISVYKHNGTLLKQEGDFVKSGEAIAIVDSNGALTTSGPHLHFELWDNGYPVNPVNYIDFE